MISALGRSIFAVAIIYSGYSASGVSAAAQRASTDVAWMRAQNLQHGINASMWFAQSRDYSIERLRSFTTEDDIALMGKLGFDHVRLSIDPAPLIAGDLTRGHADFPFLKEMDRVVDSMLQHHLAVIIDLHPESSYKATLRKDYDAVERFAMLWTAVAQHYQSRDPQKVFFEIMNEPEESDPYRWIGIEETIADAIRKVAPEHTIIATGAKWSGLSDLLATRPLFLSNIIYTFHDYEPFAFTHQGATWTDPHVAPLRSIPYPSNPDDIEENLGQADSLSGAFFVEEYGLARWDISRLDHTISFAKQWSEAYNVPVYCGEFGVLRDYVQPSMRAAWLHDMSTVLRKHGIGWAMWDYQANFGVVTKANGVATPDRQILEALGLQLKADDSMGPGKK
jgi:endoglucanase